jgi:hypothetical protein
MEMTAVILYIALVNMSLHGRVNCDRHINCVLIVFANTSLHGRVEFEGSVSVALRGISIDDGHTIRTPIPTDMPPITANYDSNPVHRWYR